ncbi:TPA: zinc transporter ZupT [Candidatus Woesearchaeota archaeon]|nr:zinc transporter ZupT [Candidatus Woesearchaeota archaeon]
MDTILFAFLLTLFAGLSTGIGSTIAFFTRHTNKKFLSFALGFSAGVMMYVSFVEILGKSRIALTEPYGAFLGNAIAVGAFFFGILVTALIDRLVPTAENPHEVRHVEEMRGKKRRLLRMGLFSAGILALHNFPEGLATFIGAIANPALGVSIAVAVAIHNIPEGIAVSVPIYHATGSRKKAFLYSFLSGVTEPIGALVGYFLLRPFFSPTMFGIVFGVVAGIMVYLSVDELLPAAREWGDHHVSIWGFIAGMAVMAVSLVLFMV